MSCWIHAVFLLNTIHGKEKSFLHLLHSNQRELGATERKWRKSKLDVDLFLYHSFLSASASNL